MNSLQFNQLKHFNISEINVQPIFIEYELMFKLDKFRELLGNSIYISPAEGSIARFDEKYAYSQHFATRTGSIKSRAIDVFPAAPAFEVLVKALSFGWGGVGVYFDTYFRGQPCIMFHFDIRERKKYQMCTFWWRRDHKYYYPRSHIEFKWFLEELKKAPI